MDRLARPGTKMTSPPLLRRLFAEFLGCALLAAVVIGSGIAAQRLSPHDLGLELTENAAATAAGLYVLILVLGPVSGAQLNPVVSAVAASLRETRWREALTYVPVQIMGCIVGAIVANGMFGAAAVSIATRHRASLAHLLAEMVATAGLVLVIFALVRSRRTASAPAAVGAYIAAAYFFTSSTSFANPAISIGRVFSDSFAGIAPASVPGFIAAQLTGAALGLCAVRLLYPSTMTAEVPSDEHGSLRLPAERRALADEPSPV